MHENMLHPHMRLTKYERNAQEAHAEVMGALEDVRNAGNGANHRAALDNLEKAIANFEVETRYLTEAVAYFTAKAKDEHKAAVQGLCPACRKHGCADIQHKTQGA